MQLNCLLFFFFFFFKIANFVWFLDQLFIKCIKVTLGCVQSCELLEVVFQIVGPLLCLLSYIGTLLYRTRGFSFRQTRSASNLTDTVQAKLQAKICILRKEQNRNCTKGHSCNSVPTEKVFAVFFN